MNGVSDSRDHASRIKNLIHHGRKRLPSERIQKMMKFKMSTDSKYTAQIIQYNMSRLEYSYNP